MDCTVQLSATQKVMFRLHSRSLHPVKHQRLELDLLCRSVNFVFQFFFVIFRPHRMQGIWTVVAGWGRDWDDFPSEALYM